MQHGRTSYMQLAPCSPLTAALKAQGQVVPLHVNSLLPVASLENVARL